MKPKLVLATTFALCLWLSGEVLAGGPRLQGPAVPNVSRGGAIQRYWRPAPPVAPYYPRYYYPYPHYYRSYGHNPRSIIVITPSPYYAYGAPFAVVTSEPYYCHMHNVGFVTRVGFLDHISGTHKIPLETANSICAESNESCIIEGY